MAPIAAYIAAAFARAPLRLACCGAWQLVDRSAPLRDCLAMLARSGTSAPPACIVWGRSAPPNSAVAERIACWSIGSLSVNAAACGTGGLQQCRVARLLLRALLRHSRAWRGNRRASREHRTACAALSVGSARLPVEHVLADTKLRSSVCGGVSASATAGQSEKHGVSELATFECTDFLGQPLHGVRVLMLTSKCWDESLLARLDRKLEDELPVGALLVDYSPRLRSSLQFVLLETREIMCSWGSETMAVFRRQSRPQDEFSHARQLLSSQ